MTPALPTCRFCGMMHTEMCPRVKVLEFYPDGTVKRVEFHEQPPLQQAIPLQPVQQTLEEVILWKETSGNTLKQALDNLPICVKVVSEPVIEFDEQGNLLGVGFNARLETVTDLLQWKLKE